MLCNNPCWVGSLANNVADLLLVCFAPLGPMFWFAFSLISWIEAVFSCSCLLTSTDNVLLYWVKVKGIRMLGFLAFASYSRQFGCCL